jgi:hypothetical protein
MGFKQTGHPQTAEVLSAEQVRALVKNEIEQSNHQILNTLQNSENRMEARFTSLETTQEKLENRPAPPMITEKDLKIFYTQLQQANATLMENYLQNATVQQQEYFQTVMNQFTDYLQAQREEDLRVIRRNLVNLKQDQDQQQQETQQILATLLNNVNNSNN